MIDRLRQQLSKFLIVEDFQRAARRDLADGCGMETVVMVAVPRLNENCGIRQAFRIHLAANVIQVNTYKQGNFIRLKTQGLVKRHTFANVPSSIFNG